MYTKYVFTNSSRNQKEMTWFSNNLNNYFINSINWTLRTTHVMHYFICSVVTHLLGNSSKQMRVTHLSRFTDLTVSALDHHSIRDQSLSRRERVSGIDLGRFHLLFSFIPRWTWNIVYYIQNEDLYINLLLLSVSICWYVFSQSQVRTVNYLLAIFGV
jgi:hypothetical protein